MTPAAIVSKLWNYCNVLRDDGMSYGDYVEQLTYLLFLKMADERTKPPYNQPSAVPAKYNWPTLLKKDGDDLFDHYRHMFESLGNEKGLLGLIFNKSQNKFQDPSKLRRLVVDLIDKENWSVMSADVKGDAYEGLLEKNAQDGKELPIADFGLGIALNCNEALDLRPPHEHALHAQDKLPPALRSRRVCEKLQSREPTPAQGHMEGEGFPLTPCTRACTRKRWVQAPALSPKGRGGW